MIFFRKKPFAKLPLGEIVRVPPPPAARVPVLIRKVPDINGALRRIRETVENNRFL